MALAKLFPLESRYILGEHTRRILQAYFWKSPAKDTGDFSCLSLWEPGGVLEIKSVIVQRLPWDHIPLGFSHFWTSPCLHITIKYSHQTLPPAAPALLHPMYAEAYAFVSCSGLQGASLPCPLHSPVAPGKVTDFQFIQCFPCCSGRYDDLQFFIFWSCMAQCFTWQYLNISALFHP